MSKFDTASTSLRNAISLAITGAGLMLPVHTAIAQDAADQDTQELEEVVVTGFRGSLNTALGQKREATAAIDTIVAEDIGKFPDSNLAESMQRIPGVTLSRGDGGEGRNISVRGLGPGFTRVRINGMEGAVANRLERHLRRRQQRPQFRLQRLPDRNLLRARGAQDPVGGRRRRLARRDRRPSGAASVRLRGRHRVHVHGPRRLSTRSAKTSIRASRCSFSKKFFDDTFGVLASVAYQKRIIREVGYSAVDILSANTNANDLAPAAAPARTCLPFCTPIGWTATGPSPCHWQPRRDGRELQHHQATRAPARWRHSRPSTTCAAPILPNVPGSGAFLPRLPRYVNSEQDTERTGGTLTLQWMPNDNTNVSLDGLISKYQMERRDNYILGLSFGRNIDQQRPADGVGARHHLRRQRLAGNRHVRRHGRALRRPRGPVRIHVPAG